MDDEAFQIALKAINDLRMRNMDLKSDAVEVLIDEMCTNILTCIESSENEDYDIVDEIAAVIDDPPVSEYDKRLDEVNQRFDEVNQRLDAINTKITDMLITININRYPMYKYIFTNNTDDIIWKSINAPPNYFY